jgi:protein tyrosine phosphatase (PTP) superfamily phosphohydrolase (DUF442 family)
MPSRPDTTRETTCPARRAVLSMAALGAAWPPWLKAKDPAALSAPNLVPISPRLVTSGQPSAEQLGQLAAMGFGAVIYLAPLTVSGAVRDEAQIVGRQGLAFVNIPIEFDKPTEADLDAFNAALAKLGDQKVLVHCQVNMRASSLVFLHRVIVGKEPPDLAYDTVSAVWSPRGPWRALIVEQLKKHGVDFDPF